MAETHHPSLGGTLECPSHQRGAPCRHLHVQAWATGSDVSAVVGLLAGEATAAATSCRASTEPLQDPGRR